MKKIFSFLSILIFIIACQEQQEELNIQFELESVILELELFYSSDLISDMSTAEIYDEVNLIFNKYGAELRNPTELEIKAINAIPKTETACASAGSTINSLEIVDHGNGTHGHVYRWSDGSITLSVHHADGTWSDYCFND